MTPLRLTTWFRGRMIPLVAFSMGIAWATVTLGYYAHQRHELIMLARGEADRVAAIVGEAIQQRPVLWPYDAAKFAERITDSSVAERARVVVRDGRGVEVELGLPARAAGTRVWGKSVLRVAGQVHAAVWVGIDAAGLRWRVALVALGSLAVAALLGALLYLVPVRAIAAAERRIAALMAQLAASQREEERTRIARELHDGAGQALTAARLHLAALKRRAGDTERGAFEPIVGLLDEAIEEVRRSTTALVPPALADLGLRGAIERHCEAFAGATGLSVTCAVDDGLPSLGTAVETAFYRIVQEALTNIARHAAATRACVAVTLREGTVRLEVTDDGAGMQSGARTEGVGLASIRARAESVGGELIIRSTPKGTCLSVGLPVEAPSGGHDR